MEDYGTSTVLVLTVIGTVIILGIVVWMRSRQDKSGQEKK
jgi:hypothetical protein